MYYPLEYEEKSTVKGFSILDRDFDFMVGDLCSNSDGEVNIGKICKSVASLVKVVWTLWQNPARCNSVSLLPRTKVDSVDDYSAWLN